MIRIVRSILVFATLVLANLAVASLHAQQAAPAPKTPSQAVLENWNDIGKRLLTMADDWPDNYFLQAHARDAQLLAGPAAHRRFQLRSSESCDRNQAG